MKNWGITEAQNKDGQAGRHEDNKCCQASKPKCLGQGQAADEVSGLCILCVFFYVLFMGNFFG